MLISFSATNFRSLKEKQTINMEVVSKYHEDGTELKNNFFATEEKTAPSLLRSAVIYGSNASGKTSLIRAIYAFNHVAMCFDGAEKDGHKRSRGNPILAYDPFLLDEKTRTKPTEFEIDFIAEKTRYVYSFSYDKEKIHHEKLESYFGAKKELIYELILDKKNKLKTNFTEHFKGKNERALDIFKNTQNNLFLPLNINEDGNKFLNPIYDWIGEKLIIENDHDNFLQTSSWIEKNPKNKGNVLKIINSIDPNIADIQIEESERKLPKSIIESEDFSESEKLRMKRIWIVKFKTNQGIYLNRSQISEGTESVFSLCSVILPILQEGGVLFFDELEKSLHPDALLQIVKMFHNPKINKGGGQIIFTSHNDILLEKEYDVFRRDQIWFAGKSEKSGATEIYSLSEFPTPTKKRDNIVERYRNHAYGARPLLKDFHW